MTSTYTKLRSGEWGIRVQGTASKGDRIMVAKKSGETKTETVRNVVWSGNGITLCAISPRTVDQGGNWDPNRFNGYGRRRGGYVKKCISGGNCSSIGSGRSCGADDCDGYE